MNAQARDRIAGEITRRMSDANKWQLTSTPEEVAAVHYLSGAEMVLLWAGISYQTHSRNGLYASLTLDGVTYPVTT